MCWIQQFSGYGSESIDSELGYHTQPQPRSYTILVGVGYGSLAYTCELTTYSIAARTTIEFICKPFPLGDSTADFKIHQTSAETPRRDCSSSKLKARLKLNDYKYICKHVSNIYNN